MSIDNETFFMHQPSEEINTRYLEEVKAYLQSPCLPCTREKALKLLKKFARASWPDFWASDISAYFPAVSEGVMKLREPLYAHDSAVSYAKGLITSLSEKALARDFLYGVAHNAPEYRTALACYYYIKNLPDHSFQKKYIGTSEKEIYSEITCEICDYCTDPSSEPKMQFWHVNVDMEFFYFKACFSNSLNTAILFLEEYCKQPRPHTDASDLVFFHSVISEIESAPSDTTPALLRKIFKSNVLNFMTVEQIDALIDMLGYLNILHKPNTYGLTVKHTPKNETDNSDNFRTFFSYPVHNWKRKHGIDYDSINHLFADLY